MDIIFVIYTPHQIFFIHVIEIIEINNRVCVVCNYLYLMCSHICARVCVCVGVCVCISPLVCINIVLASLIGHPIATYEIVLYFL